MYRRVEVSGHSVAWLSCHAMVASGLPDARVKYFSRRRPKFFFTEYGWRKCGHKILSEIRTQNLHAKIITVKENDPRLNILYRDKWQLVIAFGGKL